MPSPLDQNAIGRPVARPGTHIPGSPLRPAERTASAPIPAPPGSVVYDDAADHAPPQSTLDAARRAAFEAQLSATVEQIGGTLGVLLEVMRRVEQRYRAPIRRAVLIDANIPLRLTAHDRDHLMLFVPTVQQITVTYPTLASFTWTLQAGWNLLDYPEGTEIKATVSGTQFAASLVQSDTIYGIMNG